jgi:hypothetical protein
VRSGMGSCESTNQRIGESRSANWNYYTNGKMIRKMGSKQRRQSSILEMQVLS